MRLRAGPAWATISVGAWRMNDKDRPMPPLIAFAGALGGLAVVPWAYRTALRVNRELEQARLAPLAAAPRPNEIPTPRRAPNTAPYRPGRSPPPRATAIALIAGGPG